MSRICNYFTHFMIGLLVLLTILFVVMPAVFSSRLAVVYSGSMEPAMPTGALALMEKLDPSEIIVGDIIAFHPRYDTDVTVSHRVVEVIEEPFLAFRTKGDANEDPDWDITPVDYVIAKVSFSIPKLGYVLNFASKYTKNQLGFILFVGIPVVLLVGSAVRDMNSAVNPRKERLKKLESLKKRHRRYLF